MAETHIMIDIETFGTAPGSAILSIGAVVFDPGERLEHDDMNSVFTGAFYRPIDITHSKSPALTIDPATALWWMRQDPGVARSLAEEVEQGVPLTEALEQLRMFVLDARGLDLDGLRVWAKGPSFDLVILEEAYRACGVCCPWPYWAHRDVRTVLELAGMTRERQAGYRDAREDEHHALDDAKVQARQVIVAMRELGWEGLV